MSSLFYPKFRKNITPWLVYFILLLQVVIVIYTCVVAVHGTWIYKFWILKNGHRLRWEMGLFSVLAGVNCESTDDLSFHAICMTIFKNLVGSLMHIQGFICRLPTLELKVEEEYLEYLQAFVQSCPDMTQLLHISLWTLGLFLASTCFVGVAAIVLLWFMVRHFAWKSRACYWLILAFTVAALLAQILGLCLYTQAIPRPLQAVFNYEVAADPKQSIIQNAEQYYGLSINLAVGSILGLGLLVLLSAVWVPVVPPGMKIATQHVPDQRTRKETFWAYMPAAFQPDIFVAEVIPSARSLRYSSITTEEVTPLKAAQNRQRWPY